MKKYHRVFLLLTACVLLAGCGKHKETDGADNEELYGRLIAGLGDEEQFSLCDIGEQNAVLFTTDSTYDDGDGHNAAAYCTLYYAFDGEIYSIDVGSAGTAYPICYGDKCVYAASGHGLNIYRFDEKERQWTVSLYEEENILKEYRGSTVVNFGYGTSDNPF